MSTRPASEMLREARELATQVRMDRDSAWQRWSEIDATVRKMERVQRRARRRERFWAALAALALIVPPAAAIADRRTSVLALTLTVSMLVLIGAVLLLGSGSRVRHALAQAALALRRRALVRHLVRVGTALATVGLLALGLTVAFDADERMLGVPPAGVYALPGILPLAILMEWLLFRAWRRRRLARRHRLRGTRIVAPVRSDLDIDEDEVGGVAVYDRAGRQDVDESGSRPSSRRAARRRRGRRVR